MSVFRSSKLPGFRLCLDDQFGFIYMLNEGHKNKKYKLTVFLTGELKKKNSGPGQLQFVFSIPNTDTVSLQMDEKYCIS